MKNNRFGKSVAIVTASVLSVACLALTGCGDIVVNGRNGMSVNGVYNVQYDEAKYNVGDAEYSGEVKRINIDWIDGNVDITYHDEDSIVVKEAYDGKGDDSAKMRTSFENGVLDVRYCSRACMLPAMNKSLSVVLPKGTTLESFGYDATSAKLKFDEITTGDFEYDATSGTLDCDMIKASGEISINVTSGNITVEKALCASSLEFDSTSGELRVNGAEIDEDVSIDSTSGNSTIVFAKMCNVAHNSTSGNLKLTVPSDSGFVVSHDATSGKTDVTVPMIIDDDKYVVGDGTYTVVSDTTSGDVVIDAML